VNNYNKDSQISRIILGSLVSFSRDKPSLKWLQMVSTARLRTAVTSTANSHDLSVWLQRKPPKNAASPWNVFESTLSNLPHAELPVQVIDEQAYDACIEWVFLAAQLSVARHMLCRCLSVRLSHSRVAPKPFKVFKYASHYATEPEADLKLKAF